MIDFFKKAKDFLPHERKYWADYLFHFTDIKNAITILKTNKLYSRKKAIDFGLMKSDNASHEVIENTSSIIKEYVRFYFRPLTPTQKHNEGLKLIEITDQHCPIPIFYLIYR